MTYAELSKLSISSKELTVTTNEALFKLLRSGSIVWFKILNVFLYYEDKEYFYTTTLNKGIAASFWGNFNSNSNFNTYFIIKPKAIKW